MLPLPAYFLFFACLFVFWRKALNNVAQAGQNSSRSLTLMDGNPGSSSGVRHSQIIVPVISTDSVWLKNLGFQSQTVLTIDLRLLTNRACARVHTLTLTAHIGSLQNCQLPCLLRQGRTTLIHGQPGGTWAPASLHRKSRKFQHHCPVQQQREWVLSTPETHQVGCLGSHGSLPSIPSVPAA